MKNIRKKIIALGVFSVLAISSTPAFAAANTSQVKTTNKTVSSVQAKTTNKIVTEAGTYNWIHSSDGFLQCQDLDGNWYYANTVISIIGYKHTNAISEIACAQILLNMNGYNLVVDGKFGKNTYNAIVDFQTKYGLKIDGEVGVNTWNCLLNNSISAPSI